MDREAIIERIKKCFTLAEEGRGATEGEVEAALAAARKLMDKFNIEACEVDLQKTVEESAEEDVIEMEAGTWTGGILIFDRLCAFAAQHVCDTEWFYREGFTFRKLKGKSEHRTVKTKKIVFYGYPRDVAVCVALFNQLRMAMRTMARMRLGQKWSPPHTDYCKGFGQTLFRRARALQREAEDAPVDGSSCTAIVIYKKDALDAYARTLGLTAGRKSKPWEIKDLGAYDLGASDGSKVSLDTNQIKEGK